MSRDINKTFNSAASSTGSFHGTVSADTTMDFDPENEAIMSTRQIDNLSQKLPQLRDTAKKYGRWAPRPSQDDIINTSAIGRAFPDFSQGDSSDDNMSVEVGRGAKTRQRTPSRGPRLEYSDNIDSPVVTIGDFQILKTPPGRTRLKSSVSKDSIRNSAKKQDGQEKSSKGQKENIAPRTQQAVKNNDYISGATRNAGGEERRTLLELHARVSDDSSSSFSGDERPITTTFETKPSRFSHGQSVGAQASTTPSSLKQRATDALANALRSVSQTTSNMHTNHTVKSSTPNPTQHSFLLPNMPDISELVSGTFKDGTPVFTRNGKVQSRFSSVSGPPNHINFAPIDGIPVPEDEKAIFLSLQLLQDRIAELEMERAENQKVVEDLKNDNYQLRAENKELERNNRSDSALGMADSGSDGGHGSKQRLADKTRLDAQVASLTVRLEAAERKIATQDLRLKNNTAERDRAVQQLAEAFCTTEELRTENETLKQENEALRQQISQYLIENAENTREWQKKEAALHKKIQRREKAVKEVKEITRELYETRNNITITTTTQEKKRPSHDRVASDKVRSREEESTNQLHQSKDVALKDAASSSDIPTTKRSSRGRVSTGQIRQEKPTKAPIRQRSRSQSQRRLSTTETKNRSEYHGPEENIRNDESGQESDSNSYDETTTILRKSQQNMTGHLTEDGSEYLSILDGGEMAHLREMLNIAKSEQRERLVAAGPELKDDDTVYSRKSTRSTSGRQPGGLTGILKNGSAQTLEDLTGRLSIKNAKFSSDERDHTTRPSTSHQVKPVSTRRRYTDVDEMTSAFIIPDISFDIENNTLGRPVLSESARRVLDGLCRHNSQNCTICTRVASYNTEENTQTIAKRTVQVEKPIPVSERMPIPTPYEDEPTIRPAVAPGIALATVIKGLEDEVAHLKLKHAQLFSLYSKHDASLGMRKRKSLQKKLTILLKAIDTKSDQIYALYDVLEGQKQSGQEMTEREVEVTLMSIGVDPEDLTRGQRKGNALYSDSEGDNSSDDDSELDLPWEGIEDTTGTMDAKKGQA
ncbi:hypothetical protein B7463_g9927, partial [Scytalidium lignicola]